MSADQGQLLGTLARVSAILKANAIEFALAGGCAVYAHGGPASEHDVDVFLRERDADAARDALVDAGMRPVDPPEDWLTKAYDGDCLVDLIYRPHQQPVTDDLLARALDRRVGSTSAPVLVPTELIIDKLAVLGPHRCDYAQPLLIARSLREQIHWCEAARRTADSPYARAFMMLIVDLGIVSPGTFAAPLS